MACRAARMLIQLKTCHSMEKLQSRMQRSPGVITSPAQHGLEALLAALLFAAHPIHTEAVAGVVGHAELLSGALALLALMTYLSAASPCSNTQHYRLLAASLCMLWLAALAKEIGITMVSCSCHILALMRNMWPLVCSAQVLPESPQLPSLCFSSLW